MSQTKSWGARWIVPVDRPPIKDGALTVVDGLVTAVTPGARAQADKDLGEVAIIPLLVNAHTHLEFSSLPHPLGHSGISITEWIPQVIAWRNAQSTSGLTAAILAGLQESLFRGSTCLGEIAVTPWFDKLELSGDIYLNCFVERLGTDPANSASRIEEAKKWLHGCQDNSWFRTGISPHAPYSLSDELFEGLINWVVADNLPVAMHLAESRQELQWLETGRGPFHEMMNRLGVPALTLSKRRPMHYLQALAQAKNALVIHGNYLADDEFDFLSNQPNMHLVFCPRTHAFFGHEYYPLREILRRDIKLAVGTDSRASNPDLNVLAELQQIRKSFPDISPQTILEMGTINGARALQFEDRFGSLTPGKRGGFLAIPLDSPNEPLESILAPADETTGDM